MNLFAYLEKNWETVSNAFLVHIRLSLFSSLLAILIAIPLGILLTRHRRVAKWILMVTGAIQTIPGMVMLGIGLMLFGIGFRPAVIVLAAYAVLPMLQNTYTGISDVDCLYTGAAQGIGMSGLQILTKVQLPLALPAIVSGIRISVVYIISWATLAALIGAGGLGDLIWTGLSSYDTNAILAGAIPASLLAIFSGFLIDFIQRIVTPRGLKQKGGT